VTGIIALYRLLMVYDELYRESFVAKERKAVEEELRALDLLAKDIFNVLFLEYNRRREEEAQRLNSRVELMALFISVLALWDVFSGICALYAKEITQVIPQDFVKIIRR